MKTQLAIRLATLALWIISGPTTLAQQGNLTQATFETIRKTLHLQSSQVAPHTWETRLNKNSCSNRV